MHRHWELFHRGAVYSSLTYATNTAHNASSPTWPRTIEVQAKDRVHPSRCLTLYSWVLLCCTRVGVWIDLIQIPKNVLMLWRRWRAAVVWAVQHHAQKQELAVGFKRKRLETSPGRPGIKQQLTHAYRHFEMEPVRLFSCCFWGFSAWTIQAMLRFCIASSASLLMEH